MDALTLLIVYLVTQNPGFQANLAPLCRKLKESQDMLDFLGSLSSFPCSPEKPDSPPAQDCPAPPHGTDCNRRGNAYSRNFAAAHAGRRMDRKIHNEIFKKLAERHTAFRLSFRCFQSDLFIGFRAAKIAPTQDTLLFPPAANRTSLPSSHVFVAAYAFSLQNSSARRSERKFAKRVEAVKDSKVG